MKKKFVLLLLPLVAPFHAHGATMFSNAADGEVVSNGTVGGVNNGKALVGTWTGDHEIQTVIPFQLPTLASGESFSSAVLNVTRAQTWGDGHDLGTSGVVPFAVDFYGLNRVSDDPDLLSGDFNGLASLIQPALLPSGLAPTAATLTYTSEDMAAWLNTQYAGGANAGKYVFLSFRASSIDTSALTDRTGIQLFTQETTSEAAKPQIIYEAVPEPGAISLAALTAGAFFLRRRR